MRVLLALFRYVITNFEHISIDVFSLIDNSEQELGHWKSIQHILEEVLCLAVLFVLKKFYLMMKKTLENPSFFK